MENKMTERQSRFVDHYIELGNAVQAAMRAGYAKSTAKKSAYELLRKSPVMAAIARRLDEIKSEKVATLREVQEYWTGVMRDEDAKVSERLKASEYLAKIHGGFLDRVKHEVPQDLSINIMPASLKKEPDGHLCQ